MLAQNTKLQDSKFENLLTKIQRLETLSKLLEPNSSELDLWLKHTCKVSLEYLDELTYAPAVKAHEPKNLPPSAPARSPSLIHSEAIGFKASTDEMMSRLLKDGIDTAGGRYFGYIPGGGVTTAAFADFFSALTNRYAGIFHACPGAVEIENEVIEFFIELYNFPQSSWGTLTSGGSLASLTAILAARESRPRTEWNQSTIYLTDQCHSASYRAIRMAGLDPTLIRKIPVDSSFRMDANALRQQIKKDCSLGLKPWIVIATLGTTNTGSVDPIPEILEIKTEFSLWLHIDAAYGGFFALTESGKALFRDSTKADSIVLDPHKGLFMPYGCGAVLVKEGHFLKKAFAAESPYLADISDSDERSPNDYSPELTRHLRAPRIYLSLKAFGISPFRAALEEKLALTQLAYHKLRMFPELEFACQPELSIIAFRISGSDDTATRRLLNQIIKRGRVHMSSTQLQGKMFVRICILSFRSHLNEVTTCLNEIERGLMEISKP